MSYHNVKLFIVIALSTFFITACSDDSSSTEEGIGQVDRDVGTVNTCIGTVGQSADCETPTGGAGPGTSPDTSPGTGGTSDPGNIDKEIDKILNPNNCTEAQLGALDLLSGLSLEEISAKVGTRIIQGKITYEDFSQKDNGSIDYANPISKPVYGASISTIACDGSLVGFDVDGSISGSPVFSDGSYRILVPINIDTTLRVNTSEEWAARSSKTSPSWVLKVVDNTKENGVYYYDPIPKVKGVSTPVIKAGQVTVNATVHIPSGWSSSEKRYVTERYSAPFAIADLVFRSMSDLTQSAGFTVEEDEDGNILLDEDGNISFKAATTGDGKRGEGVSFGEIIIAWSTKNKESLGLKDKGFIGKSHFSPDDNTIYLLGDLNVNTDEYDDDVILAQLASFIMNSVARLDTISGPIAYDAKLDPRVAFSEGFPIGFATGFGKQRYFKDSRGVQATTPDSISYDMKSGTLENQGWYVIGSVAKVVHDILDDDGLNILSFEVFDAVTEAAKSGAFITIHSFINAIKRTVFDKDPYSEEDDSVAVCDILGDCSKAEGMNLAALDALVAKENISKINAIDSFLENKEIDKLKELKGVEELNTYTWGGYPGTIMLGDSSAVDPANLSDAFGTRETNKAGLSEGTSVYRHAGVFGSWPFFDNNEMSETICTINDFGTNNTLGNRQLVAFTVFNKAEFEISKESFGDPLVYFSFTKKNGVDGAKVSIRIHKLADKKLTPVIFADGPTEDNLEIAQILTPGAYILELSTLGNLGVDSEPAGKVCYDVFIGLPPGPE